FDVRLTPVTSPPSLHAPLPTSRQGPPARLSSCLIALSGTELRPGQPKRRVSDGTPIAHEAQGHERQTRATAAPPPGAAGGLRLRSEEHTSELQSPYHLVGRLRL